MENLLSTTVTIESIEDKGKSLKLKASDRKSYSFWKTKQDGSNTSMYEQFKNMEIQAGSTVNISYKIEEFTTQDGKQAHSNKVIWFREAGGTPVVEKPRQVPQNVSEGKSVDWDKLGYSKTLTNWTAELLGQGKPVNEIKSFIHTEAWELWQAIDVEADRRFNPARVAFAQKEKEKAELIPTPTEDPGEIDVDSIPF